MSVRVIVPPRTSQLRIQEHEGAFYWSACIESVLRRQGIVNVSTAAEDCNGESSSLRVFARGAEFGEIPRCALLEGPRRSHELASMGIAAADRQATIFNLADASGRHLGQVAYQSCLVRRIPASREERSDPYLNEPADSRWSNRTIRYQAFADFPGWEPLIFAVVDGQREVVALRRQGVVVLGIPLGDILAAAYAFPPLDAGYYQMISTPPGTDIETAFCDIVFGLTRDCDIAVNRTPFWPEGRRFALTVRHDCDRPVKLRDLLDLLFFYRRYGIKASFGILRNGIPRLQAWLIRLFGHEINLHSVATNAAQLAEEQRSLSRLAGKKVCGFHSHGGIGSVGFLGDHHYAWAQECGFTYVEMVGRSTRQPHAIVRVIDDLPACTELVAPGVHFSLDAGMGPEQHYAAELATGIAAVLDRNAHVVIMSHPDIHLPQLKALVGGLLRKNGWCATLAQVAEWYRSSRMLSKYSNPLTEAN